MPILDKFLRDSSAASTQDEVHEAFARAVQRLNYDSHCYVFLNQHRGPNDPAHRLVKTDISQEIMDIYLDKKFEDINFIHQTTRTLGKQVEWYDPTIAIDNAFKDFLGELYGTGYRSGISIPIYGQGTEIAFMNVSNYHAATKINSEESEIVRIMGYIFHERLKTLSNDNTGTINFSSREKEVLQWVMAGKSNSVIGDIMGISDHTVNTYLRRCYAKLGVSNRIGAVVKALSLGLISP